jgi:hypothetical protein
MWMIASSPTNSVGLLTDEGEAVMVKFSKYLAGAGAAFTLALGQSVVATPSFVQRSTHRCAASVRYLLLAAIFDAAPVLIELSMAPCACASRIFSRCLAALLRLVAAPNPIAGIAKPPDARARRLAHPPKEHVAGA